MGFFPSHQGSLLVARPFPNTLGVTLYAPLTTLNVVSNETYYTNSLPIHFFERVFVVFWNILFYNLYFIRSEYDYDKVRCSDGTRVADLDPNVFADLCGK